MPKRLREDVLTQHTRILRSWEPEAAVTDDTPRRKRRCVRRVTAWMNELRPPPVQLPPPTVRDPIADVVMVCVYVCTG